MTCNIFKIAEKVIGHSLILFLQQFGFGDSQWAFRKQSSSRDLLTILVGSWIRGICSGKKIGRYFSDIAGAFDRVDKNYMLAKLRSIGVSDTFLDFIGSYLESRIGRVTIDGIYSEIFDLCDMVFQGTVLGPSLWNCFFHDVEGPAAFEGGTPSIFADDLNVFQVFPATTTNEIIFSSLLRTKKHVHQWGRRNRVTFEESKEACAVIHPSDGEGEAFKILGCLFDVKLSMELEIQRVFSKVRPKIMTMLRTSHIYSIEAMMGQFKTHIWGYFEYAAGCILHVPDSVLFRFDQLQQKFIDHLGISAEDAFLQHNFAPITLRRDIAMLGFLHKRILSECHPKIESVFPRRLADQWDLHSKPMDVQLDDIVVRHQMFHRSIFGFALMYNRLTQSLVDEGTVKKFQGRLTAIAKLRCAAGHEDWSHTFHSIGHLNAARPEFEDCN